MGFDLVIADSLAELSVLLADGVYGADCIRKKIEARYVLSQITMRKSRKMHVGVDFALYSTRNLVERCFNKRTNARRVATSYDTTSESVLGFMDITSFHHWQRRFHHRLGMSQPIQVRLQAQ
ncbi:hypothetical protein PRI8871_02076 [Pseudoprimorskyibacter insulae]|uniref:Transposase DDE domain-containing protein n=1 Tax=Pseudoprimorskyibacter insulae TaxID=1695997 RepID=A0A2R8AWL8_9RHOB|nr:hypothetical protein PRI8871_02076 [Pseudoprimorskyibacter insulae]